MLVIGRVGFAVELPSKTLLRAAVVGRELFLMAVNAVPALAFGWLTMLECMSGVDDVDTVGNDEAIDIENVDCRRACPCSLLSSWMRWDADTMALAIESCQ